MKTGRSKKYLGKYTFSSEIQDSAFLWNILIKKITVMYFTSPNFTVKMTVISGGV